MKLIIDQTKLVNLLTDIYKIRNPQLYSRILQSFLLIISENSSITDNFDCLFNELISMNKCEHFLLFSVEGCIGVGKTTFIENLLKQKFENNKSFKEIDYLREPVDIWECIYDETLMIKLLELFYSNQYEKIHFVFQTIAIFSQWLLMVLTNSKLILSERCFFSDKLL